MSKVRKDLTATPGKWIVPRPRRISYDRSFAPSDTEAKPCLMLLRGRKGEPRKGCPIQLIFRRGEPYFRLCSKGGKRGKLVRAPWDGADANRLAVDLCASWAANGRSWRGVASSEFGGLR